MQASKAEKKEKPATLYLFHQAVDSMNNVSFASDRSHKVMDSSPAQSAPKRPGHLRGHSSEVEMPRRRDT